MAGREDMLLIEETGEYFVAGKEDMGVDDEGSSWIQALDCVDRIDVRDLIAERKDTGSKKKKTQGWVQLVNKVCAYLVVEKKPRCVWSTAKRAECVWSTGKNTGWLQRRRNTGMFDEDRRK